MFELLLGIDAPVLREFVTELLVVFLINRFSYVVTYSSYPPSFQSPLFDSFFVLALSSMLSSSVVFVLMSSWTSGDFLVCIG